MERKEYTRYSREFKLEFFSILLCLLKLIIIGSDQANIPIPLRLYQN